MTCTLGRDHRGGHRIRVPGLRPADGRVRRAAVLSGPGRLAGLMDQLDEIYPPSDDGHPDPLPG